jgi:hypothetical protein
MGGGGGGRVPPPPLLLPPRKAVRLREACVGVYKLYIHLYLNDES